MRINLRNTCALALLAVAPMVSVNAAQSVSDAERLARMEARLMELEARLAENEQSTKEVKVLATNSAAGVNNSSILGNAATYDILANSAWRNLRWTQEEQWKTIRKGMTEEQVIEALGNPPRSVKSVKPRVDKVAYYETSIRDSANALKGRVSYKDGKVIDFDKPNFQTLRQAKSAGHGRFE